MTVIIIVPGRYPPGSEKHDQFLADMEQKQNKRELAQAHCFRSTICNCRHHKDCVRRNVTRWHQQG